MSSEHNIVVPAYVISFPTLVSSMFNQLCRLNRDDGEYISMHIEPTKCLYLGWFAG
jgi:hypothetical protein